MRRRRFRDVGRAVESVLEVMHEMIRTRRREFASGAPPQSDILSLMIRSAEEEGSKLSMTYDELVSY